jgi:hypothetical protein
MPQFCTKCVQILSESTQVPPPKVKHASFNIPGSLPEFCKEHADKKTMVNVHNKTCEIEGCPKQPLYNYFGETKGRYCSGDKLLNMVNVVHTKCEMCLKDPKYIPSETNPAPEIPCARYGGKLCTIHKENGMKAPQKNCEFAGCVIQAHFNIAGQSAKYCFKHGKLVLGNACVNVTEKRCKHNRASTDCAEPGCMGSRICKMCCERQRKSTCKHTFKSDDPSKEDITTTLCITCYKKIKLADLLKDKTPEEAMKILKKRIYYKMKEAQILKSIIQTFSDKTWCKQSHVPMCDMKLTKKRYFTDLELDIGAIYRIIVENDEHQHRLMACDFARMNDIIAANNGRHLVFIRFNPDKFVYATKKYPSMFDIENEPTAVYAQRMPEVIKIIDTEIQRAALLEQSTDSTKLAKDSLIRIVYINYDDNSSAVSDAIKIVGEEQVVTYHVC